MPSKWTYKEAEFVTEDNGSGGAATLTVSENNAGYPLDDVWSAHVFTFDLNDNGGTAVVNVYALGPGDRWIKVANALETDDVFCMNQYYSSAGKAGAVQDVPYVGGRVRAFQFTFTNATDGDMVFLRSDLCRGF